jgi:hypothetical protein
MKERQEKVDANLSTGFSPKKGPHLILLPGIQAISSPAGLCDDHRSAIPCYTTPGPRYFINPDFRETNKETVQQIHTRRDVAND